MLEEEMDGHLGYEKHERSGQGNSRNGHTSKKVRGEKIWEFKFPEIAMAHSIPSLFPNERT